MKVRCDQCPHQQYRPVESEDIHRHLAGDKPIGLYPLVPEAEGVPNATYLVAVDLDDHRKDGEAQTGKDCRRDLDRLHQALQANDIPHLLETSKSGQGYHVWVVFDGPMPAADARLVMDALISEAGLREDGYPTSYDRMFPAQDRLKSPDDLGNLILLPLAHRFAITGGTLFVDPQTGYGTFPMTEQEQLITGAAREIREGRSGAYICPTSTFRDLIERWQLRLPQETERSTTAHPVQRHPRRMEVDLKPGARECLGRCLFLQHCRDHQASLSEPLWKDMISNLCRFEDGDELIHELSRGYAGYTDRETDAKIDHLRASSGPITCEHIRKDGFTGCPPEGCGVKAPAALLHWNNGDEGELAEYFVRDGCYFRQGRNGRREEQVSNFVIDLEEECTFTDDVEETRTVRGKLKVQGSDGGVAFEMPTAGFYDRALLVKTLGAIGGAGLWFHARDVESIRLAAQACSTMARTTAFAKVGFLDRYPDRFFTRSVVVTPEGVLPNDQLRIDLSGRGGAARIDFSILPEERVREVARHIVDDLLELSAHAVTYPAIGHTFLSPFLSTLGREAGNSGERCILWLYGGSGNSKTFFASRLMGFFGDFLGGDGINSWKSTPNQIEMAGNAFNDCLYLVDDFKQGHIKESHRPQLVQLIQGYADNRGRGRLRPDATVKESRPIRGNMIVTGEDLPSNEASVIARMLVVAVPRIERDLERGKRCVQMQPQYRGVMPHFIHSVIRQPDWCRSISERIAAAAKTFYQGMETHANGPRIARNLALNKVGFELLVEFLVSLAAVEAEQAAAMKTEHDSILLDLRKSNLEAVVEEQADTLFLDTLRDLLHSGRVFISDDNVDRQGRVGFRRTVDGSAYVCIWSRPAIGEVQKALKASGCGELRFSEKTIGKQLAETGALVPGPDGRSTVTVRWKGRTVRVWQIRQEALGYGPEPLLGQVGDLADDGWTVASPVESPRQALA